MGYFGFLDDIVQSVGDFFGGSSAPSDLSSFADDPSGAADAIAGNSDFSQYTSPDGALASGGSSASNAFGSAVGKLSNTLGGLSGGASSTAKELSREFRLPGQNRAFSSYDSADKAGKPKGLQSEDPRTVSEYWHSMMTKFAYGGR